MTYSNIFKLLASCDLLRQVGLLLKFHIYVIHSENVCTRCEFLAFLTHLCLRMFSQISLPGMKGVFSCLHSTLLCVLDKFLYFSLWDKKNTEWVNAVSFGYFKESMQCKAKPENVNNNNFFIGKALLSNYVHVETMTEFYLLYNAPLDLVWHHFHYQIAANVALTTKAKQKEYFRSSNSTQPLVVERLARRKAS